MNIVITSVFVDDQEKALRFYTDVLGFRKKMDVPLGHARWLTVVSPNAPFSQPPVAMGPVTTAVFEDTCGNLLQIAQRH